MNFPNSCMFALVNLFTFVSKFYNFNLQPCVVIWVRAEAIMRASKQTQWQDIPLPKHHAWEFYRMPPAEWQSGIYIAR